MSDADRYRIAVQKVATEDGELFEGTVAEFPDVSVYEESQAAAFQEVLNVIDGLRDLYAEQGRSFPEPMQRKTEYSGRFLVRAPKSLHRDLANAADAEGVSFNQLVVSVLSAHIGAIVKVAVTVEQSVITNVRTMESDAEATSSDAVVHAVKLYAVK